MSQTEVANAAAAAGARGSTRQSQALYEKDGRSPDGGYLAAVASLGVDVRYVITGSRDYAPPEPLTAEEQTLLTYWRKASSDTRKAALGALGGVKAGRNQAHMQVGQYIDGDQHIRGDNLQFGFVGTPPPKVKR